MPINDRVALEPIQEDPRHYDRLKKRIQRFLFQHLYVPLLQTLNLPQKTLKNAKHPHPLIEALFTGKLQYSGEVFTGKFNAGISKTLRDLGAIWDRSLSGYRLAEDQLPVEVKNAILAGHSQFQKTLKLLDQKLSQIIPDELAEKFQCSDIFDQTLWKADQQFQKNVKNITVAPQLSETQRQKISQDWQTNLQLNIRDWTQDQIIEIRKTIYEMMTQGARRKDLIPPILKVTRTIQDSHEEAVRKAKFLAHQESRLLLAKFKEVRYLDAGIPEYEWRCVHRPHDSDPKHHTPGNVRYSHGLLNGKIFRWDDPPVTTNPGEPVRKNNPGQDYNCRCFGRPVIRKVP